MNTSPRKSAPLRPADRSAQTSQQWPLANAQHLDNLSAAHDMLEFMRAAFLTDDSGLMLTASAARGADEMLRHIQSVMSAQSQH